MRRFLSARSSGVKGRQSSDGRFGFGIEFPSFVLLWPITSPQPDCHP